MAEQEKDHHAAGDKEPEDQSTNMSHVSSIDERKQDTPDIVKQQPSEGDKGQEAQSTNMANVSPCDERKPDKTDIVKQQLSEDSNSAEEEMVLPSNPEEGGSGDCEGEMPRDEPNPTTEEISREHPSEEKKAPDTTPDGKKNDQVDGPVDEETKDSKDESSSEKEEEDKQEHTIPKQTNEEVENIGPNIETADAEPAIPVLNGNRGMTYLTAVGLLVIGIALLGPHLFQTKSPPPKDGERQIDIFRRQLEEVKTQFPNQRAALWDRSKIHMLKHLQTAQPTEPVSLILTAGHGGEKTLQCLARRLASAFSSSLNASVLHIDGASKASQDSDQVKLDIDSKLQGAFEGDQPVAVIHRFEELPPGSTLIFYRYCDHENAAYKKTCLIFTVLLGEEEEIPAKTRLSTVEELVDDHLQKKFLSDGHPVSFDRMDLDKYSGLWSRISHLILPVAAEERIEREGC
ncbi:Torsin-1A-interacting protein 2 [Liparis tanakae]|uniref:Torsin-1A-interacting protein 2 n=1 Tax=Liparis tanakae TaxID=230148 RepID=A0A4Z2HUE8_9TELE|nr:Torsin-1A-interacting protein 2 [Liparis tanakae]